MKEFSLLMAVVDYIPVILFSIATVLLARNLYNKMSKGSFALFSSGVIDIVTAGFLKATYKLLYAFGICDFLPLSNVFFPVQALGFMLAGLGLFALISYRQTDQGERKREMTGICIVVYAFFAVIVATALVIGIMKAREALCEGVPPFSGTFVFVTMMILGLLLLFSSLSLLSLYISSPYLIVFFVITFISLLSMGYLSSKDFASAEMNWIAEGVNVVGQGSLLLASVIMHKRDLESLSLHGGELIK